MSSLGTAFKAIRVGSALNDFATGFLLQRLFLAACALFWASVRSDLNEIIQSPSQLLRSGLGKLGDQYTGNTEPKAAATAAYAAISIGSPRHGTHRLLSWLWKCSAVKGYSVFHRYYTMLVEYLFCLSQVIWTS